MDTDKTAAESTDSAASAGGSLADLFARVDNLRGDRAYPPVDDWQPSRSGNSGMRIRRDGTWLFGDSPFTRQTFVRLFASILRRDGDQHFLVTPEEKLRIKVDVAPFLVTDFELVDPGEDQQLVFVTNTGDSVSLDQDHSLTMASADDGQPLPLLHIRGGMQGLLSRSCFYRLVEQAEATADGLLQVRSCGQNWSLGHS